MIRQPPGDSIHPIEVSISTTGNIDDLDFGNADIIRMTNASLATIRGLKPGRAGQEVTIISTNAQVNTAHQDLNSSTTYRLINFVTSGITPAAAGVGNLTYKYDATTGRWRLIDHFQGANIDIPSATFTASSGTWTVTINGYSYYLSGRELHIFFDFTPTSVSATPATLRFTLPNGYTVAFNIGLTQQWGIDAGTTISEVLEANVSHNTAIFMYKFDSSNWATSTNNTRVSGDQVVPVS